MKYTIYCDKQPFTPYARICYVRDYDTTTKLKRLITRLQKKFTEVVAYQEITIAGRTRIKKIVYQTQNGYSL